MSRILQFNLIFIVFLFLFFCTEFSYSQSLTQSIRGTILDKDSKTPLPGANVVLIGSNPLRGVASDANGNFKLENVPLGRQSLRVTFLGYKEFLVSDISVNSAKEAVITAEMEENFILGKEIEIVAEQQKDKPINEMSAVSARSFTVEETNKYAGSWGDPARMASNFAGVTSSNDQRNDIVVRGNTPLGVLWRLEGMEIPSPNHFSTSGASGGAISILNNNTLDNSDFMTGAFASEYGNALSGVFDLRLRKGNNEKREYLAQVGAAGFEFGAEGPFVKSGKASYIINYRYSAFGLMGKLGFFDFVGAIPYYQDITCKLFFPYKKGNISVFGVGGKSNITFDVAKDTSTWKEDHYLMRWRKTFSTMGTTGVTWMHFLTEKSFIKTGWVSSFSQTIYQEDSTDYSFDRHSIFYTDFSEGSHSLSLLLNSKLNSRNTIKTGFTGSNLFFKFNTNRYEYIPIKTEFTIIDFKGNSNLLHGFAQWKYKLSETLTLNTGAHYLYYLLNNKNSLEPRASLKWDLTKRQSISGGFGMHSKILPSGVYFGEVKKPDGTVYRPNKSLDFIRATHYVISYDNLLLSSLRLKTEIYYQEISKAPVLADTASYFSGLNTGADYENIVSTRSLVSKGTGRNYGAEITFEKFYTRGLYFLLTCSVFDSKYKGSDGVERNTAFNSNYAFNVVGGKEFKVGKSHNNTFGLSVTSVTVGGRREVPVDLQSSREKGEAVLIYSQAYSKKVQDYFRVDGRISYRRNKTKYSQEIALDIRNMLNHKNIFTSYYHPDKGEIISEYQLGFFPVVFYKIEF